MIDHAAAWTELQAWVAAEPNRGRQQTLVKMAELAAKHSVEEDELDRALRLVAPRMQDLLFNRGAALVALLTEVGEGSSAERGPGAVHHPIAV